VSQGTLQALYEFQTQVALITGMEVANASMYDGATATAEAVMMANRLTRRGKAILSGGLHPHYREIAATQGRFVGFKTVLAPAAPEGGEDLMGLVDADTSCVVVQNPDFFGHVRDYAPLAEACHRAGALLVIAVTEPVSLGMVAAPGAMDADIVAAEGQGIGVGLNFGGPYVGLFATREKFVRQMPGRVAGETVDVDGRRGWVLTLSTREQHIRREKATSNICTNSGLCALAFTIHMALLGETGFTRLAELNHARAVQLAERHGEIPGATVLNENIINEFTIRLAKPAASVVERLARKGVIAGVPASRFYPKAKDLLLVTATEMTTEDDIEIFATKLTEALR
jgi:glycine dehydrogenase subunit 1